MPTAASISVKRGDSLDLPLTVLRDGVPLDLSTVSSLVYLLKQRPADADASAVIAFTTTVVDGVQLVVTNAALGQISLRAGASKMLLPRSRYFGALQMVHPTYGLKEFSSDTTPDVWTVTGHAVLATA